MDLVFADELKNLEQTGGDIGSEAYARVADRPIIFSVISFFNPSFSIICESSITSK